jgi:hypothetical protein
MKRENLIKIINVKSCFLRGLQDVSISLKHPSSRPSIIIGKKPVASDGETGGTERDSAGK